jgi:hypothetical protein
MNISKPLMRMTFFIGAVGLSIFLLFAVILVTFIGFDVQNRCQEAKREYGGDCTEALISLLNDTNRGFAPRNYAIWALGQFGDSRALPVLQSYYTGNIPPREPYNQGISQYELKKAIHLTSGGINIPGILRKYAIAD